MLPLFTIAFLCGDLYLQTLATLPNFFIVLLCSIALIGFSSIFRNKYLICLLLGLSLGFVWSQWYAQRILNWELPKTWESRPLLVTGIISSLPFKDQWQTSFVFFLEEIHLNHHVYQINHDIKLSWRDNNRDLKIGERWQLTVRLKRIHSIQNLGSFDYEAWALTNKLRATGYVDKKSKASWLGYDWFHHPLDQFRESLQQKIQANLPRTSTAPWLMALMIGERHAVNQADWKVLRRTGTNHLMAIAGLHIGIITGLVYLVVNRSWRLFPQLVLCYPSQQVAKLASLIAAFFYSAIAGFSIPTQRACIMLTIFILVSLLRRKINAWYAWSLALIIVLVINPLYVLSQSLWLSFGTIALIIYGMRGRLNPKGIWWKWGRVQWVIAFGLIPISLLLFHETSFVSFFANSLAIPWLGFLILPFCFISAICISISPMAAKFLLVIADKNLSLLWMFLSWCAELPFSSYIQIIPTYEIYFVTVIGFIFLLLPSGLPGRFLGIIWILPLLFYQPQKPAVGDMWITILDVGQGLSVVVQTHQHLLIYDAGPKWNATYDMGENVVIPYLHTLATKNIDMLVVSHGDNDHIGGAFSLLKHFSIEEVRTSVPEKIPQSTYCLSGQAWNWDRVNFQFIYPHSKQLHLGNDSSCVLRISNGKQTILLTGDIEKNAENNLLSNQLSQLPATILVAPHHGSKTSGVKNFIETVYPQYVVYATGYRNRYHFPHQQIVRSYREILAQQLNTAETGMIQFRVIRDENSLAPMLYRIKAKRYWHDSA